MSGRPLFEAFPEMRASIFEEKFTFALRNRTDLNFETYFAVAPLANWYEMRVYPFEDGISVYFQITSEQKRAEEEHQAELN